MDPLGLFRLDGQVAVVTGASSGLGARFARVLHAAGATVVATARRGDRLEALAGDLPGLVTRVADVGLAGDRERLVADTLANEGAIDVLVNNAGVSFTVGIEHETLEQFEQAMQVNTTAVWHLTKLVVPHMVGRGAGAIVNVASMLGHVGSAPIKQANYCASKGAVVNMTRELALQLGRKGVRVNALCPGYFPSEMTENMVGDEGSEQYIRTYSAIPRMGEEHELDGALLLLASRAGSYITGQSLLVDGGFTAR
ncbi:MAG: SDR family oxidoreductase [Ilumatobacter sp.]|uniref:SDR family NAD(P)-dependent oxidoreductase n=1 Tax=Ilumatobacter sp. TaxID=1967498 RepID=UPI0026050E55|nr:SDR family oxidoreductase [Ilumatobacter sp.]MDJ0768937.1 SDR family oxidoreductase [Ilumatobacter sp.]